MLVVSDFAAQPSSASSIGGNVAARKRGVGFGDGVPGRGGAVAGFLARRTALGFDQARANQLARGVLKVGDVDAVEQLPDLGKPLRLIAHPNDIEHGDVVAGERHVADGGEARGLPAIVGLRQPLQSEFEIG